MSKRKSIKKRKPVKKTRNTVNLYKQQLNKKDKIYLDYNATTPMCKEALKALTAWASCGNPSSSSNAGKEAKLLLNFAISEICKHCYTSTNKYTILFTGSASASNSQIIQSTVASYKNLLNRMPHIITSSIEHKSLLKCVECLKQRGELEVTFIEPDIYGIINPDIIEKSIKNNTALISIMAVNNELGSKNDIFSISKIAKKHNIPFHCDAVQLFGKERLNLPKLFIDAISVSFHKFYGPKGLGLLILSNNFIDGYHLKDSPIVYGTQQQGLLGGTEDVPRIASGLAALKHTFKDRSVKNKKLSNITQHIINTISEKIPLGKYENYLESDNKDSDIILNAYEMVILGPPRHMKHKYSPNTLLISIVKNKGNDFCNQKLKKSLLDNNVIISIGSACNTTDKMASHVIQAIKAPVKIRKGIIRISVGDYNTMTEIDKFINIFINCVGEQIPHILTPKQITKSYSKTKTKTKVKVKTKVKTKTKTKTKTK